jgi:hypothetical protein
VALDADGREIGVVLETASPFDSPREMEALVVWTQKALVGADLLPVDVGKIVVDGCLGDAPLDQIGGAPSSTTRSFVGTGQFNDGGTFGQIAGKQ